jgi:hypothetical protein
MGALHELLGDELAYDPVTVQDFSDHLPMALVALDRLGAPDARLATFSERYARSLVPVRADVQAVRDRYAADIDARGIEGAVRMHLPRFVPGIGSAAFHGVIRLAYAIEAQHRGQVAAALAYCEEVDEPLSDAPPPETADDPVALLDALRAHPAFAGRHFGTGSISGQMARVASTPGFATTAGLAVADDSRDDSLARIAVAARMLHACTGGFTALHAVTGTHAVRVVLPFLDDDQQVLALRYLFQAIAAAYLTIATPPIAPLDASPAPSWDAIIAAAVTSDDEHVVKLAYSAGQEASVHGDDATYRWCASLEAGLVVP